MFGVVDLVDFFSSDCVSDNRFRINVTCSGEIVALLENFVDRPKTYDSFSANSCVFLAHGLRYISPFPYTT